MELINALHDMHIRLQGCTVDLGSRTLTSWCVFDICNHMLYLTSFIDLIIDIFAENTGSNMRFVIH